ncbi:MAG: hypothetical protein U5K79_05020 [Cyclobacteriaceae bacterium]|nr:hypothetical protein [Cyclobacteriaceae bacterium]
MNLCSCDLSVDMKYAVVLFSLFLLFMTNDVFGQRYRNQPNLGAEEMVKFIALRNGDIVEFNWSINSTRIIKTIELKKGNMDENSIEWITVKTITPEDKKYIDYLPELGQVYYKLILIDDAGKTSEYEPVFQVKKGETTLL